MQRVQNARAQRSRWKAALLVVLGAALIAAAALLAAGWCAAGSLRDGALEPDNDPDQPDLEIVAVSGDRITLRATSRADRDGDWTKDGVFGLESPQAYGQAGRILGRESREVVREFTPMRGEPSAGDPVRLDSFAWPGDPQQAFGIPFQDVAFDSPVGTLSAWLVGGPSDTWLIFVHGRGASRREALRLLPTVNGLGLTSLVITYRNDAEAPPSPDGFYRFGETEWEDLEAAARYALAHGAQRLALAGYSMGGAIVMGFLYHSPLADRVSAVILDSPMLDFDATIDWGARGRFAPWPVMPLGKAIAALRFDVHWDRLDYLARADELSAPILLFQGGADEKAPPAMSDALASRRPDIVEYVRVSGAGHVRSWNSDPGAYEAAVREFLAATGRRGE